MRNRMTFNLGRNVLSACVEDIIEYDTVALVYSKLQVMISIHFGDNFSETQMRQMS
jgi:hypothetical protein